MSPPRPSGCDPSAWPRGRGRGQGDTQCSAPPNPPTASSLPLASPQPHPASVSLCSTLPCTGVRGSHLDGGGAEAGKERHLDPPARGGATHAPAPGLLRCLLVGGRCRGWPGLCGDTRTMSPRHRARTDTPLLSPCPLGSPVESRKIQLSPSVAVGRTDGARCWRLRPRLALLRNTLLSRSSVSCRARGTGQSGHGQPRDPPPQPAHPQSPQQCWGPSTHGCL